MYSTAVTFALLVGLVCIHSGVAINCHVCDINDQADLCMEPAKLPKAIKCDTNHNQCVKTVSVQESRKRSTGDTEEKYTVISRSCGKHGDLQDECSESRSNQGRTVRCFCSSDNCNSANSMRISVLSIASAFALVFWLK